MQLHTAKMGTENWPQFVQNGMLIHRGGSSIFSRGADFVDLFFKVDPIDFSSSPYARFDPFWANFLRRRQNFEKKNSPKKAFLGSFWKILTKNLRFFGAGSPLKISKF